MSTALYCFSPAIRVGPSWCRGHYSARMLISTDIFLDSSATLFEAIQITVKAFLASLASLLRRIRNPQSACRCRGFSASEIMCFDFLGSWELEIRSLLFKNM